MATENDSILDLASLKELRHQPSDQLMQLNLSTLSNAQSAQESLGPNQNTTGNDLSANPFQRGYPAHQRILDPLARVILCGVYDDKNVWSTLRGMRYIAKAIWEMAHQFNIHTFIKHIDHEGSNKKALVQLRESDITFPPPTDININMMPFIMNKNFEKTKLPQYLKAYHTNIISQCCFGNIAENKTKVWYLTIQESFVDKGIIYVSLSIAYSP